MIVPLARKSVIAGILQTKPPGIDLLDPGRLFFARRTSRTTQFPPALGAIEIEETGFVE
jgi:hypothetical protein